MNSPLVSELPSPPHGKTGWPWTSGTEVLPPVTPQGEPWPLITVVTPSYNQAQFLEETIRSVLLQGYPALQYFIMDGGSTDNSAEIIKKYDPWLAGWVSKRDRGQAHAVNKGWSQANGVLLGWLNSDDVYEQGALPRAAITWLSNGTPSVVYGDAAEFETLSHPDKTKSMAGYSLKAMLSGTRVPQPAAFVSRSAFQTIGSLDESLHFALDYEYFFRLWLRPDATDYAYVPHILAYSRRHADRKSDTGKGDFLADNLPVLRRSWSQHLTDYHGDPSWREAYARGLVREGSKYLRYRQLRPALPLFREALTTSPRVFKRIAGLLLRYFTTPKKK